MSLTTQIWVELDDYDTTCLMRLQAKTDGSVDTAVATALQHTVPLAEAGAKKGAKKTRLPLLLDEKQMGLLRRLQAVDGITQDAAVSIALECAWHAIRPAYDPRDPGVEIDMSRYEQTGGAK